MPLKYKQISKKGYDYFIATTGGSLRNIYLKHDSMIKIRLQANKYMMHHLKKKLQNQNSCIPERHKQDQEKSSQTKQQTYQISQKINQDPETED